MFRLRDVIEINNRLLLLCASSALLAAGCGDHDPTSVGAGLVDPGELVTFEVLLDSDRFLERAATFDGYTRASNASFTLIAADAGDSVDMDAHTLLRFEPPNTVNFPDSAGNQQTDSTPNFIGGTLIVHFDTAASAISDSLPLHVLHVAQAWDEGSATWSLRVDTVGVQIPWNEPGGTTGAVIDSAVLTPGVDSVAFAVDSQSVALWAEQSGANGVLIGGSPGSRLFATRFSLRLRARPSARPDTVVTGVIPAGDKTFVYAPGPDAPVNAVRLGGTPAWRTYLRFRERLDTITVAVPFEDETLRIPLSEATVNFAALELTPVAVPGAFRPEEDIAFVPHTAVESELIPLARSPIGPQLTVEAQVVAAGAFASADTTGGMVGLPLNQFIRAQIQPPPEGEESDDRVRTIVLVPLTDTFGLGAFSSTGGNGPRLRLVLTVTKGDES